jgi:hypothetical protein
MAAFILRSSIAACVGHEPGRIDHPQIGRTDFFRQPFGAYQYFHDIFVLARYF